MQLSYPARIQPDEEGFYLVTFRDLPEALTDGDSIADALYDAADCLEEAIAARIEDGRTLPEPGSPEANEYLVSVPTLTALKAALYAAMRESGMSKVALAERMGIHEREARRMLDPRHSTKAERLEAALRVLGYRTGLTVERAA